SVDADINAGILDRVAAHLPSETPCLRLPPQNIGKSDEHGAFPGTLSLSAETLIRAWREIGDSVARAGFRRMVIFNSHGGQPQIADIVAQELRNRHRMLVVKSSWTRLVDLSDLFPAEECRHGIHGGADETSIMLHLHPDRVRIEHVSDFTPRSVGWENNYRHIGPHSAASFAWQTQDLHPSGAVGNAALASAEEGRIIVERAAAALAGVISDTSRFDLSQLA
ncbi:MAG: creatininase family protein, partial [Pseudomonadota bacterium]